MELYLSSWTSGLSGQQLSFLAPLCAYPALFFAVTHPNAPPKRWTQSREAISALHCTLMTISAVYELRQHKNALYPSSQPPENSSSRDPLATSKLITTRSSFSSNITAFETGYLLQDTIILILVARLRSQKFGTKLSREINWRVVGWHHIGIANGLGILQWYIAHGREKGILIIISLFLMNASSPFGTLHWYLSKSHASKRRAIFAANVLYLVAYGTCRVYLVYWVLQIVGAQTGVTYLQAFRDLRTQCQVGTGTIALANSWWMYLSLKKFWFTYFTSGHSLKVK